MTVRPPSSPEQAAAMVQTVQDHAQARRRRRKCKTQRLGRTLEGLRRATTG